MKKLLLALALLLLPSGAFAQCNGIFANNTVCGNVSGAPNLPQAAPLSSFALGPAGSAGQIQTNNGSSGFAAMPAMNGDATLNTSTGAITLNIVPTSKGGTGANNSANSNADVLASNGTNGNFVKTFIATVIDTACKLIPNTCTSIFGYANIVWYGAVHNGTTDDAPAINSAQAACISTLSYGACVIYAPPASTVYCIKTTVQFNTGLTTNGGIRFYGGGVQGTIFSACGTNVNMFNFNNQWIDTGYYTVLGYGSLSTDAVFTGTAPSVPVINMGIFCVNCHLHDFYVTGGTAAIQNSGACGYTIDNVWGSFSYGDGAHVFGFFTQINCGGTIWNSHFDMVYPVSQPAHGATIAARVNTTAYTTGTIVSVTCNARTWYIQASNNGTSAGAFPGCKPYGAAIVDGTVNWFLVNAATSYCIQLDTGSIETEILHTDATCAAQYNIAFTNTYAGTPPSQNTVIRSTPGGGFAGNVYMNSGNHQGFTNLETSYCMLAGCGGVVIDNAVVSSIKITNLDCINGFAYCVNITGAASHILISQMQASGADTADLNVSAAAQGFQLVNSEHTSGAGNLFTIAAVGADHYIIANNICNGAASSDGGTGTHKSVTACSGAGP